LNPTKTAKVVMLNIRQLGIAGEAIIIREKQVHFEKLKNIQG
jgi:hypothetical protein